MNKQEITAQLRQHYGAFVNYILDLSPDDYQYRYQQKWTAGEQLAHIALCVQPIVQVFSMEPAVIAQRFGKVDRKGMSYEGLRSYYKEKLAEGGKAPERFIPGTTPPDQREKLGGSINHMVGDLCSKIEYYDDSTLDTHVIPHPLLGNLTMREMLYNVIDHVQHHHALAKQYLEFRKAG